MAKGFGLARAGLAAALAVPTFHQPAVAVLDRLGLYPAPAYVLDPAPPFGLPVLLQGMLVSAGWGVLFGLLRPRLGRVLPLAPAAMAFAATLPVAWLFLALAPIKGAPIAYGIAPGTAALVVATHLAWGFGIAVWLLALRGIGRAGPG